MSSLSRSAIGKSGLLTNHKGRFTQFRGLVDDCEFKRGEKETTIADLQVRNMYLEVAFLFEVHSSAITEE